MDEIECPYCGHEYELCTDDGAHCEGTSADDCPKCGKYFMIHTDWDPVRSTKKADCLNTGKHNLRKKVYGDPPFLETLLCSDCTYAYHTTFNEDGSIKYEHETGVLR